MSSASFTLGMYLSHVLGLANRLTGATGSFLGGQDAVMSALKGRQIMKEWEHASDIHKTNNKSANHRRKNAPPYMENAMMVDFHHMKQVLVLWY